ncbi:MAG: substrate-binding domain-containing protein [Acidimicrobiales bacterium]
MSLALVAAACGTKTNNNTTTTTPAAGGTATTAATTGTTTPAAKGSGPVDVLYAGSLVDTMKNTIGPAFDKATGYTFTGFPGGSTALESDVKGKVRQGDVFVSASPKADKGLEGAANGNWVSWYAEFATTNLVIGYNTKSKFASQLKTKPWYKVVGEPGFKLGFTDPKTDPKGVLAVKALDMAASMFNEPGLKTVASNTKNEFPEADLVGRLQSGQLDAGFFYTVEATAAKLPSVPLTPINLPSPYTVTVLAKAPHPAAADAFVEFLLGSQSSSLLKGLQINIVSPPTVSGTGVPSTLSSVLPGA